nr:PREDICTED: uncharacterized protein LOC103559374 [Equus przewalskii]
MRTEIQTLQQQFQTRSLDQHSSNTRTHVRNEHSEACPRPAEADTRGLGPIGLFEQDSPEDPDAPWSLRTLEHREDAKIGAAPSQAIVDYRQSCNQLGYGILMSHRGLIISIVFACKLLAVNLHVNKNVAIKTNQKQPTDEKFSKGSNVKKEKACEGKRSPHLLTPDLEEPSTWKVIPVGGGRKAQLVAKARLQAPGSGLQAPGPGSRLQSPGSGLQAPEVARTHFRSEVSLGIPIYKADESRAARLKLGCAGWGLGKGGQAQQIGLLLALVAASTPSMEPQGARDPSLNITLKASSSLGLIQMQETELPAGSLTLQLPRGLMQASAERVSLAMGAFLVLRPPLEDGRWRLSQAPAPSSQGKQPYMAICHPPPKLYGVPAMEEVAKNPQSPVRSQMEPQQVLLSSYLPSGEVLNPPGRPACQICTWLCAQLASSHFVLFPIREQDGGCDNRGRGQIVTGHEKQETVAPPVREPMKPKGQAVEGRGALETILLQSTPHQADDQKLKMGPQEVEDALCHQLE